MLMWFGLHVCLSLQCLLAQSLNSESEVKKKGLLRPLLCMHTALHMYIVFQLPRIMSEFLRALYGHLIPQIFLLNFWLGSYLPSDITAIISCDVKQLQVTIFDKYPGVGLFLQSKLHDQSDSNNTLPAWLCALKSGLFEVLKIQSSLFSGCDTAAFHSCHGCMAACF